MNRAEHLIRDLAKLFMPPGIKRCSACLKCKPFTEFHKGKIYRDGVKSVCKQCHKDKWAPIAKARRREMASRLPAPKAKCLKCSECHPVESYGKTNSGSRKRYCRGCAALVRAERNKRIGQILNEPKSHRRRKGLVALLSDGSLSVAVIRGLFAAAKECPYCGSEMPDEAKTIDHLHPISKGGAHSLSNVLVCCRSCNSRKMDMDLDAWIRKLDEGHRKRIESLHWRRFGSIPSQPPLMLTYGAAVERTFHIQ